VLSCRKSSISSRFERVCRSTRFIEMPRHSENK
jgi:hypothetical protein